mmetsp:Transcript_22501/g.49698  ORF Transcript_22501/g.49698 Transcript_22501/m.49698 type:complete len:113 (+) Transcript_22501:82-420(+)
MELDARSTSGASRIKKEPSALVVFSCIVAIIVAVGVVYLLKSFNIPKHEGKCLVSDRDFLCRVWRDFRSTSSYFLSGLLLCLVIQRAERDETNPNDQSGSYFLEMALIVNLS